eukprot:XP_011412903.1 PREDICTED: uncharacterized protein LOC105317841 [Crassostrea gigas]
MLSTSENSLAAFMSTVLPIAENPQTLYTTNDHHSIQKGSQNGSTSSPKLPDPIGKERANSIPSNNLIGNVHLHASSPLPEPIGKGRSSSTSSSITSDSGFYQRAPGSEREDSQMVSVSRNLDDTSHRHLMFLMASIFAQLFKSESVLLTEYECVNYQLLVLLTEYECVNYELLVLLSEYECVNYQLLVLLTEYECVN